MLGNRYDGQDCAIAGALDVLGERWTLLIVRDAFFGVRRFADFAEHLDIPRAVLSDRLKSLTAHGVLRTVPDPVRADRNQYELTAAGEELWPVLYALMSWGSAHVRKSTRVYSHAECGTRLDAVGRCPHCAVLPRAGDVVISPIRGRTYRRQDPVTVAMRTPHRLLTPLGTTA